MTDKRRREEKRLCKEWDSISQSGTVGSINSRPRLPKLAPCGRFLEEGPLLKPHWSLPAVQVAVEQPSVSMRQKKTTLPPLRHEIPLSTGFLTGSLQPNHGKNSSIIFSQPPRRPQALKPLALQVGRTSTGNQIAKSRDCRDGVVFRFSTHNQTSHSGTSRMVQVGLLDTPIALSENTYRQRRAHVRRARKQRKVGDPEERVKLVRRSTERDIFWDAATGQHLDPDCLLDPEISALPL